MRVQILSDDFSFIEAIRQIEDFTTVDDVEKIDLSACEVCIISDQVMDLNELKQEVTGHNKKVFYVITQKFHPDWLKQVRTICDSINVYVIPPNLTNEQSVEHVEHTLFPERKKSNQQVVSLLSSVSNVGVTSTAFSLAAAISTMTNAKVAVIGNDAWDDSSDWIADYKGRYLDEIKTQLSNRLIGKDEFISMFHQAGTFYFLAGNRNTKLERLYTVDEIEYLIQLAKESFDLVLIDAGSHFDNANMMQSLELSDLKLFVINQQRKAIKKFEQVFSDILQPIGFTKQDFLLIINQYQQETGFPTMKDITNEITIPHLISIPDADVAGLLSEVNQRLLYHLDDPKYNMAINQLAKVVISRTNLEIVQEAQVTKKKRWFS